MTSFPIDARRRPASLVAAVVACVAFVLPAGAATRFEVFHPIGLPVTLELPQGWQAGVPPSGDAFYARAPQGGPAYLEVSVSGDLSMSPGNWADSVARTGRQFYLSQDPHGSVRNRTVTLPAGRTIQVIARIDRTSGGKTYPLVIYHYALRHGGRSCDFTYVTHAARVGAYLPVFERSARSIRFVS